MSTESTPSVERNARKTREGLVVSDKMDKTVVVSVEDRVKHASTARCCPHEQAEGARRQRLRLGDRADHGDPPAPAGAHQALGRRGDPFEKAT